MVVKFRKYKSHDWEPDLFETSELAVLPRVGEWVTVPTIDSWESGRVRDISWRIEKYSGTTVYIEIEAEQR
jgi:hypothetical protein